ncbi:hypothetical protein [Acidithiobacillus sp.]|uniref:hypothetical protein n=1 Tax=Acidithiobacillus sp. TaxID=1872118 RepID=UPI002587F90C|nr:hypothetical protein [Acidithiobacillus sp.]MDD5375275.1 hypothetical protein [Acidithiobacillus sp.]
MLKISTGLRNAMLDSATLRTALSLGKVMIYSGVAPVTADAAVTGTLLCTITNNSTATGVTMDVAAAGTIAKTSTEVWSGVNVATGTASYYRHVAAGDTGASSTTEARVQGLIATSGAELNLTSVTLSSAATQTIDFYSITLPTL